MYSSSYLPPLQLNKQERALRSRDLVTVAAYRDRLKPDYIMEMLMLSITTKHTIRPSLGVAEFIELQFKNPFPSEQTITIDCQNPELRYVVLTTVRQWAWVALMFTSGHYGDLVCVCVCVCVLRCA